MNQKKISVRRHLGALKASRHVIDPPDLVWSGDDNIVRGTWRPPSFVEKLLSGTWSQSDRDCVHAKDLVPE